MSPLFGYLSPGDVIVSLDGIRVHKPSEWFELAAILDNQNSETSSNASLYLGGSRRFHHGKGYCVPVSLIEQGFAGKMVENRFVCPGDLTAFIPMPCSNAALREVSICLDAKDIVKLNKCGDGWVTPSDTDNKSDCVCSQVIIAREYPQNIDYIYIIVFLTVNAFDVSGGVVFTSNSISRRIMDRDHLYKNLFRELF